jgi:hypothetical protein
MPARYGYTRLKCIFNIHIIQTSTPTMGIMFTFSIPLFLNATIQFNWSHPEMITLTNSLLDDGCHTINGRERDPPDLQILLEGRAAGSSESSSDGTNGSTMLSVFLRESLLHMQVINQC